MIKLNNYFDKIYCLNLSNEKERALKMINISRAFDFTFEFFTAISGNLFDSIHKSINSSYLTNKNYVACALSHLSIYQNALDREFKKILIIEDDLLVHKNINTAFNELVLNQIPKYWDLLYLAWIPLNDDQSKWDYNIINDKFISNNVFRANGLWSGMGYGINEKTMRWMINRFSNSFDKEIDRVLVKEVQENSDFKCYGITPQLFAGYNNFSANSNIYESGIFERSHDSRRSTIDDYK